MTSTVPLAKNNTLRPIHPGCLQCVDTLFVTSVSRLSLPKRKIKASKLNALSIRAPWKYKNLIQVFFQKILP
jgi:hypothetical protein